jgi:hypothetical protein
MPRNDAKYREAVMLIKLLVTNEMLLEVQDDNDAFVMLWWNLLKMHETSDNSRVFLLRNILFSIKMEELVSLPNHLLKIKDIRL